MTTTHGLRGKIRLMREDDTAYDEMHIPAKDVTYATRADASTIEYRIEREVTWSTIDATIYGVMLYDDADVRLGEVSIPGLPLTSMGGSITLTPSAPFDPAPAATPKSIFSKYRRAAKTGPGPRVAYPDTLDTSAALIRARLDIIEAMGRATEMPRRRI